MKIYAYKNCDSCRRALKWLKSKGIEAEVLAVRETPPTMAELRRMLGFYDGEVKRLLNTSGRDYRELNLKDRLPGMTDEEVLALLSENGNLIKRPFLLGDDLGLVGFREGEWAIRLGAG